MHAVEPGALLVFVLDAGRWAQYGRAGEFNTPFMRILSDLGYV